MTNREIIKKVASHVKVKFFREGTGHDWYHIERVWKMAKKIGLAQKTANVFIVELGALLHDIADWKFYKGDFSAGPKAAEHLLKQLGVKDPVISQVKHIVEHISYKGSAEKNKMETLEGKIVQDADRLDAIGAIGIARTFAYGGSQNRLIYDPKIKIKKSQTAKQYTKNTSATINHFYEKLLLLKDRMNTKEGKRIALRRHKFLEIYLKEFYQEWKGVV